jgi:hypothetical protein
MAFQPTTCFTLKSWRALADALVAKIDEMTDELITHFGSAEAALTAVKCGEVSFQKITDDDQSDAA